MAEYTNEEIQKIIAQNEQLSKKVDELTAETKQLKDELREIKEGYKTLSSRVADTFKRMGSWIKDKLDFTHELMNEDVTQAKAFVTVLRDNFLDLTDRVGQSTKNMFDKVTDFFKEDVPMPFNKMLDFTLKQYQAEVDAHFLDIDTKTLNTMEKITLAVALQKGKIQDNKEEWISTLKHEGWKLAEKLGLHQEKNKELGQKFVESTKLFGEAIKGIGEVTKEIPQPAVNWVKTNLIDTIPKSVEHIKNALETSKDYTKKAFTLSVPEFFKAAKEGVEKAIAEKEGYKMMANGDMVAPTLSEVVKNKYQDTLGPVVDKFKNIGAKLSGLIKKEGAYQELGPATKELGKRTTMLSMETVGGDIPQKNVTAEEVKKVEDKAIAVEQKIDNAMKLTTVGGHNSPDTIASIGKDVKNLTETIDQTVGKEFVKGMEDSVKETEIVLAVSNDLGLKPTEMSNTEPCEQYLIEKATVVKPELATATVEFSYFYSEKNDAYIVKEDITTKTGQTTSILYDTKDLDNPIRINEQKEMGGESRTIFDKATKFLAMSALANGVVSKIMEAMPAVKESIKEAVVSDTLTQDTKEIGKDAVELAGK